MKAGSANKQVLLVEQTPFMRFGIASLIELHPLMEICGEASNAREARQRCREEQPDIMVLNLTVVHGHSGELLRDIARFSPLTQTIVISEGEDPVAVQSVFRSGARACLSSHDEGGELLAALECVLCGGLFTSRRMSHILLEEIARDGQRPRHDRVSKLSDRELQIFRMFGSNLGVTAIAADLGISIKTVETHQQRIKEKLQMTSCAELSKRAGQWVAGHHSRPVPRAPKRNQGKAPRAPG